jgi:PAS domain S-box-containing protein
MSAAVRFQDLTATGLAAIVEGSDDAIISRTLAGVITSWNAGAAVIFGYSVREMLGEPIARLIPPDLLGEETEIIANLVRGERIRHFETIRLAKDGRRIPVSLAVSPLHDEVGEVVGASEIARDISDRKLADEQRERLLLRATTVSEERAHFTRAASHDLREPLRTVTAFCDRLSREYADRLDARGAEYLSLAVAGASRMSRILDDLLDFERLAADANGCWFESSQALDRALANLSERAGESHASITSSSLPRIWGNPVRFERLLQNLIGNALKYVAPGAKPRVDIDAKREGEFWRFSVADNGVGIDPRFHDRIFEPFKRLHSRQRFDGVGLGLTICRKIVEGFGGAISVQSSEGAGSIFSFTVGTEGEEMTTTEQTRETEGRSIELLLVEDSYGDVLLTREACASCETRINLSVAGDGEEAMDMLRQKGSYAEKPRPDLILLDLNLPRMDGREVLQAIRNDSALQRIHVIVLCSSAVEVDLLMSSLPECDGYIVKPVDFHRLHMAMESIKVLLFAIAAVPNAVVRGATNVC